MSNVLAKKSDVD